MSNERIGPWITTYTGKRFYPLDPRPEEVDIEDIAQSSALTTRYRGHIKEFYSVAQHETTLASYILMRYGNAEWAMKAMVHDSGETYTADIPAQTKDLCYIIVGTPNALLYSLEQAETRIMNTVFASLRMQRGIPDLVHDADLRIRYDEAQVLRTNQELYHDPGTEPLGVIIKPCWQPNEGRQLYMKYFGYLSDMLTRQRVTGRTIEANERRPLLDVLTP